MPKLTLNQRLAVVAVILGAVAIFADVHRGRTLTLHEKELATRIERTDDHVTASELAAWIVAGRNDYRLIDLRDPQAYVAYHVPTAENRTLSALGDEALLPTEKLVLYSDGGIHASQAMMLLWAKGVRNTYMLLGGLDAWKEEVLFPVAPSGGTPQELAAFERAIHVARFFGGQARAAASATAPAELPRLEALALPKAPPPPPATGGPRAPRKKKEGC